MNEKNPKDFFIADLRGEENPQSVIEQLAGRVDYFCLGSSEMYLRSIYTLGLMANKLNVRLMIDANLSDSPQQMFLWGEKLRNSNISMVTIQCSAGLESMKAFMASIKKPMADEEAKKRPLVFAVMIPPYMEESKASVLYTSAPQKLRTFSCWVKESGVDGIIIQPNYLKQFDNKNYAGLFKIVSLKSACSLKLTPAQAISYGANFVLNQFPAEDKETPYVIEEYMKKILQ